MNPELFLRVGINPSKGCLLYGPPGMYQTETENNAYEYMHMWEELANH